MTKRTRRNHSGSFKAKVAVAALCGDKTLTEITQYYEVYPNQVPDKTLHAKIGQLALENDFLNRALTKAGLLSAKK